MSEIDIHSRLEELKYYEKITNDLSSKFDALVKSYETSQESLKVLKEVPSSNSKDSACEECLSGHDGSKSSLNESAHKGPSKSSSEETICASCLSKSDSNIYSSIWHLPRSEKLKVYEKAISECGRFTEPEMAIPFNDGPSTNADEKKTFAEITKYQRDVKRKRMKYRTTKAPPLTHTEEIRSLISLQMELWEDFVVKPKITKKN